MVVSRPRGLICYFFDFIFSFAAINSFTKLIISLQSGEEKGDGSSDLLDANLGVNDDDLLGDFGDNFNILEFADALDGNDSSKTNILDDLEGEEEVDVKPTEPIHPPPYTGNQFPPGRGPPPPYPGPGQPPTKVVHYF